MKELERPVSALVQHEMDMVALNINSKMKSADEQLVNGACSAREAGRMLIEAQEKCIRQGIPWLPWVAKNIKADIRTVQRRMNLARNYPSRDTLSHAGVDGALNAFLDNTETDCETEEEATDEPAKAASKPSDAADDADGVPVPMSAPASRNGHSAPANATPAPSKPQPIAPAPSARANGRQHAARKPARAHAVSEPRPLLDVLREADEGLEARQAPPSVRAGLEEAIRWVRDAERDGHSEGE